MMRGIYRYLNGVENSAGGRNEYYEKGERKEKNVMIEFPQLKSLKNKIPRKWVFAPLAVKKHSRK